MDNQTIDEVGARLVRSASRRGRDIDKLVGDPHLFARVRARINQAAEPEILVGSASSSLLFGPKIVAVTGFTLVLLVTLAALGLLRTGSGDFAVRDIQIPDVRPDDARPVFPPQEIEIGKLSAGRASDGEISPARAVYRRVSATTVKSRKTSVSSRPAAQFYPVAYTGDPAETDGGGRIIRVDLKRSSLFALGVDIPLENDEEIIKADLLISNDGVTRAIRLVE